MFVYICKISFIWNRNKILKKICVNGIKGRWVVYIGEDYFFVYFIYFIFIIIGKLIFCKVRLFVFNYIIVLFLLFKNYLGYFIV